MANLFIYITVSKTRILEIVFHLHNKFISLIQALQMEFHMTSLNKKNNFIIEMEYYL